MDRTTARNLIKTTLDALMTYELVNQGAPGAFKGRNPVAIISSRSMALVEVARDSAEIGNGLTLTIYVRHDSDDGTSETQLDTLVRAALLALYAVKDAQGVRVFSFDASNADIASGNLRDVDRNGTLYRVERIPINVYEEGL